jgi:hypothetical protein
LNIGWISFTCVTEFNGSGEASIGRSMMSSPPSRKGLLVTDAICVACAGMFGITANHAMRIDHSAASIGAQLLSHRNEN